MNTLADKRHILRRWILAERRNLPYRWRGPGIHHNKFTSARRNVRMSTVLRKDPVTRYIDAMAKTIGKRE